LGILYHLGVGYDVIKCYTLLVEHVDFKYAEWVVVFGRLDSILLRQMIKGYFLYTLEMCFAMQFRHDIFRAYTADVCRVGLHTTILAVAQGVAIAVNHLELEQLQLIIREERVFLARLSLPRFSQFTHQTDCFLVPLKLPII
jgi:hypothetical protein